MILSIDDSDEEQVYRGGNRAALSMASYMGHA
jgi:hypothetical protein